MLTTQRGDARKENVPPRGSKVSLERKRRKKQKQKGTSDRDRHARDKLKKVSP